MADGPIRSDINQREAALRRDVENIADMPPTLQQIAVSTGAPGDINPGEIPTVGYLANLKAAAQTSSQARANRANVTINNLPGFKKSYRSYLEWRYPSRYGKKSTGKTYDYSNEPYNPYGGLTMPDITGMPGQ